MEAEGSGGEWGGAASSKERGGIETTQTDSWKGGVSQNCWGNTLLTLWRVEGKHCCEGFLLQGHGWTLPRPVRAVPRPEGLEKPDPATATPLMGINAGLEKPVPALALPF